MKRVNPQHAFYFLSILFCIFLRLRLFEFESGDYIGYFKIWYEDLQRLGPKQFFLTTKSDYNHFFMYLWIPFSYTGIRSLFVIKSIGLLFDLFGAIGCYQVVKHFCAEEWKARVAPLVYLLTPTVIMNSSLWGQVDGMYGAMVLWSFYFMIKDRATPSIVLLAFAFTLKLQTIFVFPFYLVMLLNRKFNWKQIIIFPLIFIGAVVPSWIMGKPLSDLLGIYIHQAGEYQVLSMNAPNMYLFANNMPFEMTKSFGIWFSGALVTFILYIWYQSKRQKTDLDLLKLIFIFSVLVPFTLPAMHERYFFIADVFCVIFLIGGWYGRLVPSLLLFSSTLSYLPFLTKLYLFEPHVWAVVSLLAVILLVRMFMKEHFSPDHQLAGSNVIF